MHGISLPLGRKGQKRGCTCTYGEGEGGSERPHRPHRAQRAPPACHAGRPWPEKAGLFQESGVLGARLKAFIGLTEKNQMETAVPGDSLLNYLLVGSLPVN